MRFISLHLQYVLVVQCCLLPGGAVVCRVIRQKVLLSTTISTCTVFVIKTMSWKCGLCELPLPPLFFPMFSTMKVSLCMQPFHACTKIWSGTAADFATYFSLYFLRLVPGTELQKIVMLNGQADFNPAVQFIQVKLG